jgi:hypothetical protein
MEGCRDAANFLDHQQDHANLSGGSRYYFTSRRQCAAMFAPKIAKAQRKAGESFIIKLAPQRSTLAKRPLRGDNEQDAGPTSLTARGATHAVPRDFSNIPLFQPDGANRPQTFSQLTVLPQACIMQPKLAVGQVNDPLEHEADRVADQVMCIGDTVLAMRAGPQQISRNCAACEGDEKTLKMKSAAKSAHRQFRP